MIKISVIVPVYNAEKYVAKCIESILAQTYENWELLLIDDGSVDCSSDIIRKYETLDKRVKGYFQENAGPGVARNKGMSLASGDYIVFLDSDDYITNDYLDLISKKNADVIFIDAAQVDISGRVISIERMSQYKKCSKDEIVRAQMTGKMYWAGWRKVVKREILVQNNILYSAHKIGEEALYSFKVLVAAQSVDFVEKVVYSYVNHAGSQSKLELDDPWGDVALTLRESIVEAGLYAEYANTVNAFIVTAAIVSLDKLAGKYGYREYNRLSKNRICKFKNDIDKEYPIDYYSMSKKALMLYPFLKVGLVQPVYAISCFRRFWKKHR